MKAGTEAKRRTPCRSCVHEYPVQTRVDIDCCVVLSFCGYEYWGEVVRLLGELVSGLSIEAKVAR